MIDEDSDATPPAVATPPGPGQGRPLRRIALALAVSVVVVAGYAGLRQVADAPPDPAPTVPGRSVGVVHNPAAAISG